MKPVSPVLPHNSSLPEVVYGKDQPEYLPLPAVKVTYADGTRTAITRWRLTLAERIRVLFHGSVWLEQMTFGEPLQPLHPTAEEPKLTQEVK